MIKNVDFSKLFDLPMQNKALGLENYESMKLFDLCGLPINVTIFNSWLVILLITAVCYFSTRNLSAKKAPSKWQLLLEMLVSWLQKEAKEAGGSKNNKYLGMAMGLFCFIFTCNLLTFIPWFRPPTASLSTTMAQQRNVKTRCVDATAGTRRDCHSRPRCHRRMDADTTWLGRFGEFHRKRLLQAAGSR